MRFARWTVSLLSQTLTCKFRGQNPVTTATLVLSNHNHQVVASMLKKQAECKFIFHHKYRWFCPHHLLQAYIEMQKTACNM